VDANDTNNYVEEFDTRTKTIKNVSSVTPVYGPLGYGGLTNFACLIPMLEENAFVITGGAVEAQM
jgi:hypothetical protein